MAKALGVERIRFEPLISDAGLAKTAEGFEIVINTEAPGATEPPGSIFLADDGRWNELRSPLRFSVAHELAHVPFLISAGRKRFADVLTRNQPDVERGSSVLARTFLLPRKLLIRELGNGLFDVSLPRSHNP